MAKRIKGRVIKRRQFALLAGGFLVLEAMIWTKALNEFWGLVVLTMGINIILTVSLNLINGYTGQFSLGHAGFMAIGAYAAAVIGLRLAPPLIKAGIIPSIGDATVHLGTLPSLFLPFSKALLPGGVVLVFSMLLGGVAAAIFGFLIGLPTLRLRGDYLAIATLGFGEIIRLTFNNIEYFGAATGLPNVPRYTTIFGTFMITLLVILLIGNIVRSKHGRAMMAVREDEIAAEAMGINTTWYKVAAFTIGAFFAGVAGALYAHTYYLVNPKSFTFMTTVDVLVMVVLGGLGSIWGSIAGAILITALNAFLSSFPTLRMIFYALFLIVLMIFLPRGLLTLKDLFNPRRVIEAGETADAVTHK